MTPTARTRFREFLVFLGVWLPHAFLVRRFWFVTDDAYISFRYMRNWAGGHGLRYNLGEHVPVEGYSNFLLVAAGTLMELLGLDLEVAIPLATFACAAVLLAVLFRVLRGPVGASLPVAAVCTAAVGWAAPFAVWSTGGLATMPYALLLFALFERLLLRRGGPDARAGAVLAVALALVRVEGVYWALVILALAALSRAARGEPWRRPLALVLGALVAGYAAYFGWRWAVFGAFWANTVQAKVHLGWETVARGLDYAAVQVLSTVTFLVVVPGAFVALRRERRAVALPTAAMAAGFPAFAVLVGGDFMTFGRFLVPALAFDGLLLAWIVADVCGTRGGALRRAAGFGVAATVVVAGCLPAWDVHAVPRAVRARFHFRLNKRAYASEVQRWREQHWRAVHWAVLGDALAAIAEPGDSVVLGAMGAVGYRSGLTVHDCYGLVTPSVAQRTTRAVLRSPGHDDPVAPDFFLEQGLEPTFLGAWLIHDRARARIEGLRRELRSSAETRRRYVFDVLEVPRADDEERSFLCLWRRLPPGVDPDERWREATARTRRLMSAGEVPAVDMPPTEAFLGLGGDPRD